MMMMMMMRNYGYIVCKFTVTVLKFVPGHCAARLVPLHQTTSAADTARLVFNSSSGHVRHRDRGDTGKNYYLGFRFLCSLLGLASIYDLRKHGQI